MLILVASRQSYSIDAHLYLLAMPLLRGKTPRSLAFTVSTTNCESVRDGPYKARLELIYDYLVEYRADDNVDDDDGPDVIGVGNAIAYGVAAALDTCSATGAPLYAVDLTSRHEVFENGEFRDPM